jgi:hypothetical protein
MRGASIHADYSAELWMSQLRSEGLSQETRLSTSVFIWKKKRFSWFNHWTIAAAAWLRLSENEEPRADHQRHHPQNCRRIFGNPATNLKTLFALKIIDIGRTAS